jgi:hypothetical protein
LIFFAIFALLAVKDIKNAQSDSTCLAQARQNRSGKGDGLDR